MTGSEDSNTGSSYPRGRSEKWSPWPIRSWRWP